MLSSSWRAMPTTHGKPPPPYTSGNGTPPQPASTKPAYASLKPEAVLTELVFGIEGAPFEIPHPIERRNLAGHEPAVLLQETEHRLEVGVTEAVELGQRIHVDQVAENEGEVAKRGAVVGHRGQARRAPRRAATARHLVFARAGDRTDGARLPSCTRGTARTASTATRSRSGTRCSTSSPRPMVRSRW